MRQRKSNGRKMGKKEVSIVVIFVFVFLFLRFSYNRTLRQSMSAETREASVSEGYISILDQSIHSKSYKPDGPGEIEHYSTAFNAWIGISKSHCFAAPWTGLQFRELEGNRYFTDFAICGNLCICN